MSYKIDRETGDITFYGFEQGIAPSPHKGIAAIKNANISTEQGEVMCNYIRSQLTITPFTGQTLTYLSSTTLSYTGTINFAGYVNTPITIGSGITGLSAGNYYISAVSGSVGSQVISLTTTYRGSNVSGMSAGSATFSSFNMTHTPFAHDTETYFDGTTTQYRYYIADKGGFVWVLDTGSNNPNIFVPVQLDNSAIGTLNFQGIAVYNGYLILFRNTNSYCKETTLLGIPWASVGSGIAFNGSGNGPLVPHFCLVSHSGTLNYTDGNFIGTVVAAPAGSVSSPGVFSYGQYTFSTYTLTQTVVFAGEFPLQGQKITFTTSNTLPTGISANTVYYVCESTDTNAVYNQGLGTFSIKANYADTAAISLSGGAGTQYFNTFSPLVTSTYLNNPTACTINTGTPIETAISLAELGNTLIIGTNGNSLYQWDEISSTWTNFVPLVENNAAYLLTVNNIVLVFAGTKGNVYVTSGSAASGVLTVPDYLAGIPGNANSYIEPYFTWGQAFYARGRVFFSIQDQTASKTGNCGGIYSFIPSFYNAVTGQDVGTALRLENFNSYGTYNGLANVLFANQNQSANGVQYFSAWTSDISTPTYGIDTSGTTPYTGGQTIVETDLISTGQLLGKQKQTFSGIEFKCSAPLQMGESVKVQVRQNGTSAWQDIGNYSPVGGSGGQLAAYYSPITFEKGLWLQLKLILTSIASNPSFTRLTEVVVHQ